MKTKRFITIAAAMLFMLASLATHAQDVYEYATISFNTNLKLYVSYSNGKFEEIPYDKNDSKPGPDVNQTVALKHIAELSKQGWEIVGFSPNGLDSMTWRYLLKRKVK